MKENQNNFVGYKIRLFPSKEQEKIFYRYFGLNRFVYNFCINLQEEHYIKYEESKLKEKTYKRLSYKTLTGVFTKLRKTDEYFWLNKYSVDGLRGAIRDCCKAYKFYDSNSKHYHKPKYKSKIYSKKQFSVRGDTLSIKDDIVWIPSIGYVKYYNSYGNEIIGTGYIYTKNKYVHYYNPRISYDGIYFYLSFNIPTNHVNSYKHYLGNDDWNNQSYSESIGIDVGLKNEKWMIDSTGHTVKRPDSTALRKRINRLQRKYDRQKNTNLKRNSFFMKQHPYGSKNMQKTLTKINKCFKKITNRRRNTVHEYTKILLNKKPKAIVIENISVQNILNNHTNINDPLSQLTYDAAISESINIIETKMINNNIKVIRADPDYPSSQLCSNCGHRQNIKRAKYFKCTECGTVIDRDLNAAINLSKLAY